MSSNLRPPLNGTRTHPLKPKTLSVLRSLKRNGPIPCQELNAGSVDRLTREDLAEIVQMPSPYKTRKGDVGFLRITETGVITLKELEL